MKDKTLSDKIVRNKIKAEMQDTKKWGRIPMIKLNDGSYCAEEVSHYLEVANVKDFIQKLKVEMFLTWENVQIINELAGPALIHSPNLPYVNSKDTPDDSVQKSASDLVKTNGINSSGTHGDVELAFSEQGRKEP